MSEWVVVEQRKRSRQVEQRPRRFSIVLCSCWRERSEGELEPRGKVGGGGGQKSERKKGRRDKMLARLQDKEPEPPYELVVVHKRYQPHLHIPGT